jgi:peptide/nickel transport system substrate-binding protein
MKFHKAAMVAAVAGLSTVLLSVGGTALAGVRHAAQAALQKENTVVSALPIQVSIDDFAPIASATAYTIYNSQVEYMMWAPLVMVSSSDTIDWADSLAQSITPNSNDTAFTVVLKPWKWSNGQPITAEDVAFTTNLLLQACTMKNAPYSYGGCGFGGMPPVTGHAALKGVQVVNPRTVVFTLTQPANPIWFELNNLGQIQPMPKALWDKGSVVADLNLLKKIYNDPTAPQYKVVSGPYKFASMVNNEYWKFVPNPQYGGHKATTVQILQYEASDAAEFAALRTQQINVGYLLPSMFGSASQLNGLFVKAKILGFCWQSLMLNSSPKSLDVGATFQDEKVRAALQYGIDENALGKVLYGAGLYIPDYSAIPPGFPNLTRAVFGASSLPTPYPYNPAKGKALLISDGWHLNSQGVMQKGNVTLSFPVMYDSGSTETANAAVILAADWAKMGVKVTPTPVAFNTLVAMQDSTPGEASKWAANWYGGWCYEPNFYPTGAGMWQYYQGVDDYSNPQLNAAIQKTYAPATPQQAKYNMYAYALATAKLLPMLWMPVGYTVVEYAPYVQGVVKYYDPVEAFTLWNWITIKH